MSLTASVSDAVRLAPAREPARWSWLSRGSFTAATLWLIAAVLFTLYVRLFASYQKTCGAIGGVVVLLMWFYLSSFVVVLGAGINAESERQTYEDTTTGAPVPMGQRGACAADTVGPAAAGARRRAQERIQRREHRRSLENAAEQVWELSL